MAPPGRGCVAVAPGGTHGANGSTTGRTLVEGRPGTALPPRPARERAGFGTHTRWLVAPTVVCAARLTGRIDHLTVSTPGYGEVFADVYDEWYGNRDDVGPIVEAISAGGTHRRVLELGAGTGRLALPLAEAGHHVVALDDSVAMLARLEAKLATTKLTVEPVLADAAGPEMPRGPFDVVLGAFDFLANLADHDAQARCLALSAARLEEDGVVILDGAVPDGGGPEGVWLRMATRAPVRAGAVVLVETVTSGGSPVVSGAHVEARGGAARTRRWRLCLVGPDQLDRFAAAAGLRLLARTGDWDGGEFDAERSPRHVSVYGRVRS